MRYSTSEQKYISCSLAFHDEHMSLCHDLNGDTDTRRCTDADSNTKIDSDTYTNTCTVGILAA